MKRWNGLTDEEWRAVQSEYNRRAYKKMHLDPVRHLRRLAQVNAARRERSYHTWQKREVARIEAKRAKMRRKPVRRKRREPKLPPTMEQLLSRYAAKRGIPPTAVFR